MRHLRDPERLRERRLQRREVIAVDARHLLLWGRQRAKDVRPAQREV